MAIQNVGFGLGFVGIILPLIMLIIWVAVIVAIFQIRNSTRDTSEKLDRIFTLLLESKKRD